jgi:hypothetical protein
MSVDEHSFPAVEDDLLPDVLSERLREISNEGRARRLMENAVERVVSWSWTTTPFGASERVEPLWPERYELGPRGREVSGVPAGTGRSGRDCQGQTRRAKTYRTFGRDQSGRVVVARLWSDKEAWLRHLDEQASAAEVWVSDTESVVMSRSGKWVFSVRRTSGGVAQGDRVSASVSVEVLVSAGVAEGVAGEKLGGGGVIPAGAHVDGPGGGVGVVSGVSERGDGAGGFDGCLVAVGVVVVERDRAAAFVGEPADRADRVGVVVGDGAAFADGTM